MAAGDPIYTIVVPTYNERENVPILISLIAEAFRKRDLGPYEVLLVDDNSPDGTAKVFEKLIPLYPEADLRILKRSGKLGLGSAYMAALKIVRGQFVILMDADLSHNPKYIPAMIRKQRETGADIVSGTRYALGGGVCGWDLRRIVLSRTANHLAHLLLSPRASDLTGSFRLYKRDVLKDIMGEMISKGYVFQMEVITRASRKGCKIAEVPIQFVDRIYGESKLGTMEIVEYAKGLGMLFWEL